MIPQILLGVALALTILTRPYAGTHRNARQPAGRLVIGSDAPQSFRRQFGFHVKPPVRPRGRPAYPGWVRVRAECRNCKAHNGVDVLNAGVEPGDPISTRCGVCGQTGEMTVLLVGEAGL